MPIRLKANDPRIPASLREQVKPKRQKRPKADPQLFINLCVKDGLPAPVPEYRFAAPDREWRFDWAWVDAKIALEVQGGVFSGGGHVRGAYLRKEYRRLSEAAIRGWRILYLLPEEFARGGAIGLVRRAMGMD